MTDDVSIRITAEELLRASEPDERWLLEGPEVVRVFWALRGARTELARQQAFWESTNEAVANAYELLEARTRELADARRQLEEANQHLEQRVAAQVAEILERAREIDALNLQLRAQVQERSRELATALRRLAEASPRPEPPREGVQLGRVRLGRQIGSGGCGVVYLGHDTLTSQTVAVKLLRVGAGTPVSHLQRFIGEASAAARVSHPGAVRTLFVDVTEEGQIYLVMELVDGISLSRAIASRRLVAAHAARIGAAIAEVLVAAHASGVIHRDIKPNNVLLCLRAPGVRVLDFGLAKLSEDLAGSGDLTIASQFLGTPAYMSPEQVVDARSVSSAADCYSLGVMLHEMIAGRPPFVLEQGVHAVALAHLDQEPSRLDEAPAELADLVLACLAKRPEQRPSAAALANALTNIADAFQAPAVVEVVRAVIAHTMESAVEQPTLQVDS